MTESNKMQKQIVITCVSKEERRIFFDEVIKKCNFTSIITCSIYEALRQIEQTMPHLIICDSILPDGTVATIYDKIRPDSILKTIPILVIVVKKTKEHLVPLTGRSFEGILMGEVNGGLLKEKIMEILNARSGLSPHFVPIDKTSLDSNLILSVDALVLGSSEDDKVIYKSNAEIDPGASFVCVPKDKNKDPVLLNRGLNVIKDDGIYNVFPIKRARGKGIKWLFQLPKINISGKRTDEQDDIVRKVVFYDPKMERFTKFKEILRGYNIELFHASSLQSVINILQNYGPIIDFVYLDELPSGSGAFVQFKEFIDKFEEKKRLGVIIATTSQHISSDPYFYYIRKPFSLSLLLEMMENAYKNNKEFENALREENIKSHLEVFFQTPAKLVGFDEHGSILEVRHPISKSSKLRVDHPFINKIWNDTNEAIVTDVFQPSEASPFWYVRVEKLTGTGSKVVYWERVSKLLSDVIIEKKDEEKK
ncbi:MAG: hypothetical protein HQK54_06500 [Oligoflexales bacterium]|nr:hypothetical protein [Oligoflexales bacterium]